MTERSKPKLTVAQAARDLLQMTVTPLPQDKNLMMQCAGVKGLRPDSYVLEVLCLKFFVSFAAMRSVLPGGFSDAFLRNWETVTREYVGSLDPGLQRFASQAGFDDLHAAILQRTKTYFMEAEQAPRWAALDTTSRTFARLCCGRQTEQDLWKVAHFYYNTRRNELLAWLKSSEFIA